MAAASGVLTAGQRPASFTGVLDEHPSIQYATRPTTDRVAKLNEALAHGGRSLRRDAQTGYLAPVLDALGVPVESQLLVFSKTGVQRAYTGPHTPRAIFYDESAVVAYVPGAPFLEVAAHDPQQGVVFYTLDQTAAAPAFKRQTSCLTCHVSYSTLNVPGVLARSHTVAADGNVMAVFGSTDVTHETPHPDRWGGWYVTADPSSIGYAQRAHSGNITFDKQGSTSNQVFIEWMNSAPESRGYLSPLSDIAALLVFDHEMNAINLLTRLNWESRVASNGDGSAASAGSVREYVNRLADYLLFVGEQPPSVPLTPQPGFAARLEARTANDRRGRSFGQLNLDSRLLRYPCSYMVYSAAFDGLPPAIKQAVYLRMIDRLSATDAQNGLPHVSPDDRRAILEILRETKSDFPGQ